LTADFESPGDYLPLNCPERSKGQFWGQKIQGPIKKSQEMPHYMFYPRQKICLLDLQNQRYIGIFMSRREKEGEKRRERERASERAKARATATVREEEKDKEREREQKCGRFYF
jgi:hypothetical protein